MSRKASTGLYLSIKAMIAKSKNLRLNLWPRISMKKKKLKKISLIVKNKNKFLQKMK